MKKVLMLTAKETEIPFILQAKMLGYYVITTGNAPEQVGHKYGDQYIPFDYSDFEGIAQMAKDIHVDAVMSGCSDNCVLTAAYICDHLGLKGHDSFETTEIIHRKDKFKKFALENRVKTPLARWFDSKETAYKYSDNGFPVIIKPSDMAGGKGVSVAHDIDEMIAGVDRAFEVSRDKKIVIEPYIEGSLHSLHVFIVDEKVRSYGTANDYSYKNKYMTSYGIFPADNWETATEALIPEINRLAKILHLVDGQMDIQYIMGADGPWIVEMMRRFPGNHTTSVIANSIGIDWREWICRAELGESVKGMPCAVHPQKYYGYYALMADHNGCYDGMDIDPLIRKYVIQIDEWHSKGYEIEDYMYDKMALIQFYFDTESERQFYLPQICNLIKVKYS